MRICLFRAFPDPFRKSMEIYANQLLAGVRPLLHDGEEIVESLPADVRVRPKYARYWDQYIHYQRFCKAVHGDVNHIVDHGYGHLVHSLPAHRTVVTFHDAVVAKVNGIAWSTQLSFRYCLSGIRKAAAVIAVSQSSRRDFLTLVDYPEDKVKVVYQGIDPSFRVAPDREALRAGYGLPQKYVLSVGHTLSYANVEGVFRVLECLMKRYGMDLQLIKVGDQFTAQQEMLLDKLGLRQRVIHLGKVPFRDLPAMYTCAEALLYPVLYAGFGLPPLEAMACGTPVVCSDRGSLPEIVGDAAIVTDPENHQQMALHIARLLSDDSLRATYRTKGLEQVQRYSWDKTAREVLAIYRQVYGS
jgi:glycosyltransferase involved in cell wall biosynthesis